jgi:hypothetical protein
LKTNPVIPLVKSLTKSEKRYIKVALNQGKTSPLLPLLLNYIEKHNRIPTSLPTDKDDPKTSILVSASRLNQFILKELRNFHAKSSQSIELNHLIIEIEILYNKRLFSNCYKLILKAKKLAEKHNNHLAILSLLKWESFIEKEEGKYLHKSQNIMQEILDAENEVIESYKKVIDYKYHTFNILLLSKNKAIAELNREIEEYDLLMSNNHFFTSDDSSFDEKLYALNFKGMYYMSQGNYLSSLNHYKELVELFENSGRQNILISNEYFLALNNSLLLYVMNSNLEEYYQTLSKIYKRFQNIKAYDSLLFNITRCYELGICCELGNLDDGLKLIPQIKLELKKYESETNDINRLLFYLNLAIINFFNNSYSESIFWLNEFLNDYSIKRNDVTSNIYYYSHIINLLVHFEAKNFDSIQYLYKESITNLKKIRKLNLFDQTLLKFILVQSETPYTSSSKRITAFKDLKSKLKKIAASPSETTALQFFDFFAWIESHIQSKPIHILVKQKKLGQL